MAEVGGDAGRGPLSAAHRWLRAPSAWRLPGLLLAAWTVFAVVWIWSNPLGAAPDETDHYIRAVAAGHGDLTGSPAPLLPSDTPGVAGGRRYFTIPMGMATPVQFACDAVHAEKSAACANLPDSPPQSTTVQSGAGTYVATAYVLPGLLMRLASDPYTALPLGRLGSALLSLSLLAAAVALLWSRARSSFALLGVILAVTPMQIFLLTEVGPNGLEIAAAICFAAGLIRLARHEDVSAWHWAGLAYGGVLLGATRPLGPEWIAAGIIIFLVAVRPSTIGARVRQHAPAAAAAGIAIAAAVAFNLWWQVQYPLATHVTISAVLGAFWDNVNQVPTMLRQMVGVFGWVDTYLPEPIYQLWMIAVLALAVVALMVGSWRQRLFIGLLGVGIVLLTGAMSAYISLSLGHTIAGQGVQGRYMMPIAIAFPLVCGEVVHLQRARFGSLDPRRLVLFAALVAAFVQFDGWYLNSRRYAVGANGSMLFFRRPEWQPPGGWIIWLLLALLATCLMVLAGIAGLGPIAGQQARPLDA